jgi:ABC transport system ATP-binding/permease protein
MQAAAPASKLRRLGFREKEEYARLEGEIERLSSDRAAMEALIGESAQGGDFGEVQTLTAELAQLSDLIDKKTDRWLELAERFEAAGSV